MQSYANCVTQKTPCYTFFMNKKDLPDEVLLEKTYAASKVEKTATLELLEYLVEVDARRLYAIQSCSSLFDFVVRCLGYSRMQASERVNSARLMMKVPGVQEKIEKGELSMTAASQVYRFLNVEKKSGKEFSNEETIDLIDECAQKSTREIEKTLLREATEETKLRYSEKIKEVSESLTELKFLIPESTYQKLTEVKNLIGHESLKDIFDQAMDALLHHHQKKQGRITPVRKANVNLTGEESLSPNETGASDPLIKNREVQVGLAANQKTSRFISIRSKRIVSERSKGQCEYVNPQTLERCNCRYRLQIDHVTPKAKGGSNEVENLRHLCFQHNQRAAMEEGISLRGQNQFWN